MPKTDMGGSSPVHLRPISSHFVPRQFCSKQRHNLWVAEVWFWFFSQAATATKLWRRSIFNYQANKIQNETIWHRNLEIMSAELMCSGWFDSHIKFEKARSAASSKPVSSPIVNITIHNVTYRHGRKNKESLADKLGIQILLVCHARVFAKQVRPVDSQLIRPESIGSQTRWFPTAADRKAPELSPKNISYSSSLAV